MPKLKPGHISPTNQEEAEIQRHIAEDPEAPEMTAEEWARARPAIEVDPDLVEWSLRRRGKQKASTKELVSIRLDKDVVAHFRSSGPGWQTRLNDRLRQDVLAIREGGPSTPYQTGERESVPSASEEQESPTKPTAKGGKGGSGRGNHSKK